MKLAHISDLHLNTLFNDSNPLKIKKLIKYISSKSVDHLVISGDLTDNADEGDLNLLKKILTKEGFVSSSKLTIVPGNHDIFGGPQKPIDIFSFPDKCKEVNYNEKLEMFTKIFNESFENTITFSKENQYPFIKIVNNILIIGINSVAQYSKYKNPFASNGEVNLYHFNILNELFQKYIDVDYYKVAVIHHHFNKIKNTKRSIAGIWQNIEKQTMKLKKKKRLISLFKKYDVDIVLHGHIHYNEFYERKGIPFLNAGASISGYSGKSLRANLISFEQNEMISELHKITDTGEVKIEELFRKVYDSNLNLSPNFI